MGSSALHKDQPRGANVAYAAAVKRATGLPAIAVGKLGDGAAATRVVEDGLADLVAIGRQLIADPLAAGKILSGRSDEIVRCRECLGCFASLRNKKIGVMRCATNLDTIGAPRYAGASASRGVCENHQDTKRVERREKGTS